MFVNNFCQILSEIDHKKNSILHQLNKY